MILAALVLEAAAPQTAVDAERAFAAAAQVKGQWTAFREYAAADATMFVPQPVNAQGWLKDKVDPPKSVEWWPTASYVSCDGKLAVNTGGSRWPSGAVGYFTTVWERQRDGGWKWIADHGDALDMPRDRLSEPKVARASCGGKPEIDMGGCLSDGIGMGCYAAVDQTLQAHWRRTTGGRSLSVVIWTGRSWKTVLEDYVSERTQ